MQIHPNVSLFVKALKFNYATNGAGIKSRGQIPTKLFVTPCNFKSRPRKIRTLSEKVASQDVVCQQKDTSFRKKDQTK